MEGSDYDDDLELPTADITLVLVGKIGCGKSATGNSIIGRDAFVSEYSYAGVTNICQIANTTLRDGRTINVIDTPGLFDMTISCEDAGKEIVKCMSMAKDGIHAVLMVFSATSHFSREDSSTIETIKESFGEKIVDHMILVFTYGDMVGETKLKSMLNNAPEYLQKIVELCKNRVVLFDNMTKDRRLQAKQLDKLLDVFDSVNSNTGGKPFSDQMLTCIKEAHAREQEVHDAIGYAEEQIYELKKEIQRTRDEQLANITNMVEEKLNITVDKLQQQLMEEQNARLEAERLAAEARLRSDKEIRKLKKRLEKENEKIVELCQKAADLFDIVNKDQRHQQKQLFKLHDVITRIKLSDRNGKQQDCLNQNSEPSTSKQQDCPYQNSEPSMSKSIPHVDHKKIPIREVTNHYFGNIHNIRQGLVCLDDSHYSELRPVLRDGESFYRSFIFSYLEQIVDRKDTREEDHLLAAVRELASRAELLQWASEFSRRRKAFETMIEKIKGWKVMREYPISMISHNGEEFLLEFFSNYGTTDDIFAFLRLAAVIWMCSHDHREMYEARVTGLGEGCSLEDWCSRLVIRSCEDAEGVAISALAAALQVGIRLEHPNDGNTEDVYYTARDTPHVTLMCIDSHYDILYPLPPGATTASLNHPAKSSSQREARASWFHCCIRDSKKK